MRSICTTHVYYEYNCINEPSVDVTIYKKKKCSTRRILYYVLRVSDISLFSAHMNKLPVDCRCLPCMYVCVHASLDKTTAAHAQLLESVMLSSTNVRGYISYVNLAITKSQTLASVPVRVGVGDAGVCCCCCCCR